MHSGRIDRQHRRILTVLERTRYLEADDGLGRETISNVLAACLRRHFADEEEFLRAKGCPGGATLKRERERVMAAMLGCTEQLREERAGATVAAFEPIREWFARHVSVSAGRYGASQGTQQGR